MTTHIANSAVPPTEAAACVAALPERSVSALKWAALLLAYAAVWMLLTPYAGLTHDAQAYAFQALAKLNPETLGQDVFLRFDSQDRFTVFPHLYALLIQRFNLEWTAAVLTFACHVGWFAAAFLIAHRLFGTTLALVSLGLLISIPGPYGGLRVFHFAEPFLSARLPAEVLTLFAIWAALANARVVCVVLLTVAALVHPLMAFPVMILIALAWIDRKRPMRLGMAAAAVGVVASAALGSFVIGGHSALMPSSWVETAHSRSAFLFLDAWTPTDWNHTIITLSTLALGAAALGPGDPRRWTMAALCLGLAGLVLTAISNEVWHLRILLQGQPWRWLWVGRFFAIATLPVVLLCAWRSGTAGKSAALLLAAAWLAVVPVSARSVAPQMLGSVLALIALLVWLIRDRIPASSQPLVHRGAIAVLGVVLLAAAVTASLAASVTRGDVEASVAMQRFMNVLYLVSPTVLIAVLSWAAVMRYGGAVAAIVLAAGVAGVAVATPLSVEQWTKRTYTGPEHERFADWRARIPADAEVFWWDGLREVWFLLERRSYLTVSQGGGLVFSDELTQELRRRAQVTSAFIDPGFWFNELGALRARPWPLTREILARTCVDPQLGFVVSTVALSPDTPRQEWPSPGKYVYLHDCKDYRAGRVP